MVITVFLCSTRITEERPGLTEAGVTWGKYLIGCRIESGTVDNKAE
jgi:hypothetical protein